MRRSYNKKAFTLIELLVAIGLLVAMIAGSGLIFKYAVKAQRAASSTGEIMAAYRAVTGQLNADFKGIRKDMPIVIKFETKSNGDSDFNIEDDRLDQIMFFSDGDFQSTRAYGDPSDLSNWGHIRGNIARIHYAFGGKSPDEPQTKLIGGIQKDNTGSDGDIHDESYFRFLTRRQHILTQDDLYYDAVSATVSGPVFYPEWDKSVALDSTGTSNLKVPPTSDEPDQMFEHDSLTIAQWKMANPAVYEDFLADYCFDIHPRIDIEDTGDWARPAKRVHMKLVDKIASFSVELMYKDGNNWLSFPVTNVDMDEDDDGDDNNDSHFEMNNIDSGSDRSFGVVINGPFDTENASSLFTGDNGEKWYKMSKLEYDNGNEFDEDYYPRAIKFTFKLYDSRGIFPEGKRFTHIVYLDD